MDGWSPGSQGKYSSGGTGGTAGTSTHTRRAGGLSSGRGARTRWAVQCRQSVRVGGCPGTCAARACTLNADAARRGAVRRAPASRLCCARSTSRGDAGQPGQPVPGHARSVEDGHGQGT